MPTRPTRNHAEDLVAASRLLVDATERVTSAVEAMHTTIASGPDIPGNPLSTAVRAVNGLVYGGVRGVTRLVGLSIERALTALAPLLGESAAGADREALLAVLNGVIGDYLVETQNPLAITMQLRVAGHPLEPAAMTGRKALVLVHGSCMNDLQWTRGGHDHGAALARDLGFTPISVHYNSGLHVSENGRQLSALLEGLVGSWNGPLDELVLLGHSMGGLVARSACVFGEGTAWRKKLTRLICLGTPHHGAPLERGGNWIGVLLGISRYSAPISKLARLRSAGVTDLRYGNVLDEHWAGRDRFAPSKDTRSEVPLPSGVDCYAIAATTSREGDPRPLSDGIVPVDSALGRHSEGRLTLGFPQDHQWIGYGMAHLDLLSRPEVFAKLREWLAAPATAGASAARPH